MPARELVAGWCECVKQGAVSSQKLFEETTEFLQTSRTQDAFNSSRLEQLIASHCAFKASIVAADQREHPDRFDRRSRRILNFGHTIAHALEAVTDYRRFRHGEAVGQGMLVAGELSKNLGLLDQTELELLTKAVRLCGPLPTSRDLDERAIVNAIAHDKKRTAGRVQWVLLERIGRPRIVDGKRLVPRCCGNRYAKYFAERNGTLRMNNNTKPRKSEQGGARLKFLIVAAILGSVAYAGYQFIPVFIREYQIKGSNAE